VLAYNTVNNQITQNRFLELKDVHTPQSSQIQDIATGEVANSSVLQIEYDRFKNSTDKYITDIINLLSSIPE